MAGRNSRHSAGATYFHIDKKGKNGIGATRAPCKPNRQASKNNVQTDT
jgi:hypothetical protein